MPLPKPNTTENRSEFISRCVSSEAVQNESSSNEQALAICISQWENSQGKNNMSINDKLLEAIRSRKHKHTEFNYGILTADRYVKTVEEIIGLENCYKFAAKGMTSFADVLEKAAKTLVYSNPDMVVEDKDTVDRYPESDGVELPKNTLMVFRHVLTTPRKDRDGDILRTEGLVVDPKMLLLWQHIHTMPIGKMLVEVEHNEKRLVLDSCIVDMNRTCHDAAVMIENDMGRFSHGFRATEINKLKEDDGTESGFDVLKGEIMEESLVSVPSNVDADTMEVILSLVESGKLTSPVMKEMGRGIREKRNVTVPINLDIKVSVNGQGVANEDKSKIGKGKGIEANTSSPKETNADTKGQRKEKSADKEVTKMMGFLPGSWEHIEDNLRNEAKKLLIANDINVGDDSYTYIIGTFADHAIICNENFSSGSKRCFRADWEMKDGEPVFSGELKEVKIEVSVQVSERMKKRLVTKETITDREIDKVVSDEITVKEAMALVLAKACEQERKQFEKMLGILTESDRRTKRVENYRRALKGSK